MTDTPEAPDKNAPTDAHSEPPPELHPELRPELRNWCVAWKSCLENVLSQVSGKTSATFEISAQPLAPADSDVWYTVVAGGAVHGEMALRLPAATGTRLARTFLGETEPAPAPAPAAETADSDAISADNKEALEELLRQIAGLASTALAATVGGEVQLVLSAASAAPTWSSDAIACLHADDEAGLSTTIEIRISPALVAALLPALSSSSSQAVSQTAPNAPPSSSTEPSTEPPPNSSYRRLMDVGLDVKLRFGTRRMLLRDVLALSAGVVVELDNSLHSPVDLLLDGRLIAQGEVVVVDGKYGLRVTNVIESAPAAVSPG
ncbi:MAG: flagellar motor switch protein FliN [Terriglobales bacterium]|jgi:flagellar motor switch protein FliN